MKLIMMEQMLVDGLVSYYVKMAFETVKMLFSLLVL